MTYQELLEMAAKASEIKGAFIEKFPKDGCPTYCCGIGYAKQIVPLWNPLEDDGDALRLCVYLELGIDFMNGDVLVLGSTEGGGDPYNRARRAIVRAAAEIGKSMP